MEQFEFVVYSHIWFKNQIDVLLVSVDTIQIFQDQPPSTQLFYKIGQNVMLDKSKRKKNVQGIKEYSKQAMGRIFRYAIGQRYNNQEIMIEGQIIELLSDFRRTEFDQNLQFPSPTQIDDNLNNLYNTALLTLLETAQKINLNKSTKFMAKKYLDKFLNSNPNLVAQKPLLAILTCLRVAIKFNEASNVPYLLSIHECCLSTQGKNSHSQFLEFQFLLINVLGFRFRVTTPYDFIVVKKLLPQNQKFFAIIESTIDFAITLIDVRSLSAQIIFFASLIYCCRNKNATELCYQIIKATTLKFEEAVQLSEVIEKRLNELLQL